MCPSPIFNVDKGKEVRFFIIFRCWMNHEYIPLRPDAAKCWTAIPTITTYKNCITQSGHSQCEACLLLWLLEAGGCPVIVTSCCQKWHIICGNVNVKLRPPPHQKTRTAWTWHHLPTEQCITPVASFHAKLAAGLQLGGDGMASLFLKIIPIK
jgi:hypothetical protein